MKTANIADGFQITIPQNHPISIRKQQVDLEEIKEGRRHDDSNELASNLV
jgi:hypothetical protein